LSNYFGTPVLQIENGGFQNQTNLKKLKIPPNYKIGMHAFDGCTKLKELELGGPGIICSNSAFTDT
jgi:hypothetical protein